MLIPPAGAGLFRETGFSVSRLRARSPRQRVGVGFTRIKDGLGIALLRATSAPPGAPGEALGPLSRDPTQSSRGLLHHLQAQVRPASPLLIALARGGRTPHGLNLLQAQQIKARSQFRHIDGRTRLLLAHSRFHATPASGGQLPRSALSVLI